jgi:hypothetical protein
VASLAAQAAVRAWSTHVFREGPKLGELRVVLREVHAQDALVKNGVDGQLA